MKKATKILLVVVLATFGFQSYAQTYGLQAGLNIANISMKANGEKVIDGKKMLIGFNVGVTSENEINDALAIQMGLILHQKGVTLDGDPDDLKTSVMALDVPLNLKFKADLGNTKLYFAAGPYVSFNVSGKVKVGDEEESIEFGNDATQHHLKRLDYGLNIGTGVEFGTIGIGAQYGIGFANILPEGDSDNKFSNRLLSVFLTYRFGK